MAIPGQRPLGGGSRGTAVRRDPMATRQGCRDRDAVAAGIDQDSLKKTGRYSTSSRLAPALLWMGVVLLSGATAACLNPTYIGGPVPRENHVPVVEAFPAPSFAPLPADVGGDCAPLTFDIVTLQDADGDTLTARFDMLVGRNDRPVRVLLRQSPPLTPLDNGFYPLNELTTLELSEERLGILPGALSEQTKAGATQLVELRVSDTGFVADENGNPVAAGDGGLVFLSWMVKLNECVVVTP